MPDGWSDLLRGVDGADPPLDLRERIQQRRSPDRVGRAAGGRRWAPMGRWVLAGVGVGVLVVALALAAHSNRGADSPSPGGASTPHPRTISSHGVHLVVPSGWESVKPASDAPVTDPRTLLVVGTHGVQAEASQCQIAVYHVPPTGAVVVVVGWTSAAAGGGSLNTGRGPLDKLVAVHRPGFECFEGRGAAAQVRLGGTDYQVNVMVGDRASRQQVSAALAVARSFDLNQSDGTKTSLDLPHATFPSRAGWYAGSSSDPGAPVEETFTWVSTTPFLDAAFSLPPGNTLAAMSPDDILIEVWLWRPTPEDAVDTTPALPIRLNGAAESTPFPGEDTTHWYQQFRGAVSGRRGVQVGVFIGRRHPTPQQISAAQSMLDSMTLPDWPSPLQSEPALDGGTINRLTAIAKSQAQNLGDPSVHTAQAVLTTTRLMNKTLGFGHQPQEDQHSKVYVIQLRGTFTCDSCSHPPGASAPTGTAAQVVLSYHSFSTTDFGLTLHPVTMQRMGTIVSLSWK
jgi:hypothetical protein